MKSDNAIDLSASGEARRSAGQALSFSVVTPSFNQARFLPITLASVANQSYGPVEHLVIDPGSTDGSLEIASDHPAVRLIHEPDDGQADGINKGFSQATGDVLCWLNSDDLYASPTVLEQVAAVFQADPAVDVVYGGARFVDESGDFLRECYVNTAAEQLSTSLQYEVGIIQPSVFFRREVIQRIGGLDRSLEFTLDYEFWIRLVLGGAKWKYVDQVLSHHRWWGAMKTARDRGESYLEHLKTVKRHFGYVHHRWVERYAEFLLTGADGIVSRVRAEPIELKHTVARLHLEWNAQFLAAESFRQKWRHSAEERSTLKHFRSHQPFHVQLPGTADPLGWQVQPGGNVVSFSDADEQPFAVDGLWWERQRVKVRALLDRSRAINRERTCVIVDQHALLDPDDAALLANFDVMVCGRAADGFNEELVDLARYVVLESRSFANQYAQHGRHVDKALRFYPVWLAQHAVADERSLFLDTGHNTEFSANIEASISWSQDQYCVGSQIAYSLGFGRVLLFEQMGERLPSAASCFQDAAQTYRQDDRELLGCAPECSSRRSPGKSLLQVLTDSSNDHQRRLASRGEKLRVLVLSASEIGSPCATGALTARYFDSLGDCEVLQLYAAPSAENSKVRSIQLRDGAQLQDIHGIVVHFAPHVVYFRPSDTPPFFFQVCARLIGALDVPVVSHLMDDWMSRPELGEQKGVVQSQMREILHASATRLAISPGMAAAYKQRYGFAFYPLANFVTPIEEREPARNGQYTIRYCGGLDPAMAQATIAQVARAIDELNAEGTPVRFEIYTMSWYLESAESLCSEHVSAFPLVADADYPDLLASSDLLLIGYNFDASTLAYVRYSMANKLADYLSAGVPVLLIGPEEVETIRFCKARSIGHLCTDNDVASIKLALLACLRMSVEERAALVERSHAAYGEFCGAGISPQTFRALLTTAAYSVPGVAMQRPGLVDRLKFNYRLLRLWLASRFRIPQS